MDTDTGGVGLPAQAQGVAVDGHIAARLVAPADRRAQPRIVAQLRDGVFGRFGNPDRLGVQRCRILAVAVVAVVAVADRI